MQVHKEDQEMQQVTEGDAIRHRSYSMNSR